MRAWATDTTAIQLRRGAKLEVLMPSLVVVPKFSGIGERAMRLRSRYGNHALGPLSPNGVTGYCRVAD